MAECPDILVVSDSHSDEEDSAMAVVSHVIDHVLHRVVHDPRDFSDMFIKVEPPDDIEESNMGTDYRDVMDHINIKVESDSDSDSDSDSSIASQREYNFAKDNFGKIGAPPRTKNELMLTDLPPVEELDVTVTEAEAREMGRVSSVVNELVVVKSNLDQPALDLDTILFLESGSRTLGRVFDVIGPVRQPFYCVRFNSADHVKEKEVEPGMPVYFAPKSEFTSFVFLEQLMNMKISDASWRDDEEPPPEFLDYSDDEEERQAKMKLKAKHKPSGDHRSEQGTDGESSGQKRQRTDGQTSNSSWSRGGNSNRGGNRGNRNDGNMGYNAGRTNNGLYSAQANPFYRQSRTYNPRDQGPITWSNYNLPPPNGREAGFGQPPPPAPIFPAQNPFNRYGAPSNNEGYPQHYHPGGHFGPRTPFNNQYRHRGGPFGGPPPPPYSPHYPPR